MSSAAACGCSSHAVMSPICTRLASLFTLGLVVPTVTAEVSAVCVSWYPSDLSAQANHVLKVLRRPGDYGLTPGVWYAANADELA